MPLTSAQKQIISNAFKEQAAARAQKIAQSSLVAIRIDMQEPAPDGAFEILFMPEDEAGTYIESQQNNSLGDTWTIIPFSEGVELTKRADCSGGYHTLEDAAWMSTLNPEVRALELDFTTTP